MSSSAGPWSVKGIDPRAREIAKDLARRSGLTLGEWLNQKIVDDDVVPPYAARRPAEPAAPVQRLSGFARPEPVEPPTPSHLQSHEMTRVAGALEALSDRVETAERRSTLAISGIDQSVLGLVSRLEAVERDQGAVAARFDGALDELRQEQARLSERSRRSEQTESVRMEASKALEAALGKVASQLYESEERTRAALTEIREDLSSVVRRMDKVDARFEQDGSMMENLIARVAEKLSEAETKAAEAAEGFEQSMAALDSRVASAEARAATAEAQVKAMAEAEPVEVKFDRLATELSAKVEQARTEMTERLAGVSDGKFERMEAALKNLGGAVDQAERRSAQAIDRMGREVLRIAHTLGGRVSAVEARSAEAVDQVGGEMARIADAMENRLRHADSVQAAALEKLGGEIGRIAERLAERISASERRSVERSDTVGDQVARLTEKLDQRQTQAVADVAERLRQSEERTIRLLQDAQAKLDQRFAEAQRQAAIEAARFAEPVLPEPEPAPVIDRPPVAAPVVDLDPFSSGITRVAHEPLVDAPEDEDEPSARAAAEPATFAESDFLADDGLVPFGPAPEVHDDLAEDEAPAEAFAAEPEAPAEDATILHAEEAAADVAAADEAAPAAFDESLFEPESEPAPLDPRSAQRRMLDDARAAARQSAADPRGRRGRLGEFGPVPAPSFDASRFAGLFKRKPKRKEAGGATLRTTLLASGTALTLGMAAAGYWVLTNNGAVPRTPGPQVATKPPTPTAEPAGDLAAVAVIDPTTSPAAPADPAAIAGLPTVGAPAATAPLAPRTVAAAPKAPSRPTRAVVEPIAEPAAPAPAPLVQPAQAATPQPPVRALYGAAVRQIETGDNSGVASLRQAANLGYAPAQFYLGKLYETGGGGLAKNPIEARRWTERAAQAGDPKAMHNLALYFFEGEGGAKNATMAANWFLRAAQLGLQDSQYNLARLNEQGFGVPQNPAEAYKWYLIAASNGDADARAGAERVKRQLSPDAQAAAERSAAALRAQITGSSRSPQTVAQGQ
jgi:localization factor PodJL